MYGRYIKPIEKHSFSCCAKPAFMQAFDACGRREILLTGIETHICVCQTEIDLMNQGCQVQVVADCVSSRTPENRQIGLDRLAGAGAEITSVEMAFFELMKTARCDAFKQVCPAFFWTGRYPGLSLFLNGRKSLKKYSKTWGHKFMNLLKIAGHGPMEPQIRAWAQTYLPGCHKFSGRIPSQAMPEFYRSGHIFAFPGIRESLGMVFLEAQACGLPVVAFDTCGIPDIVISGKTGFLVPCFNSKAFSGALDKLIKDRELSGLMGRKARENTRRHHDITATRRMLAKALSEMMS